MRRALPSLLIALAVAGCAGNGADDEANLKVISLTARRWSYEPPMVTLKLGEPVILEITSADVHHGFNLPDFDIHAAAIPGQTARVKITPDKLGGFAFFCDFYCGTGHEGMAGQLIVE